MKKVFLLLIVIISLQINGQDCPPITAKGSLIHGGIKANLLKSEDVYNQVFIKSGIGEDGSLESREYVPLIYSENVLIGGVTRAGTPKISGGMYHIQDWTAGPLNQNGVTSMENCSFYDRIFTVTKEEIVIASEVFANNGPCEDIPQSIREWPAIDNQFVINDLNIQSKIYFFDENADGKYNPCDGDLPSFENANKFNPTHFPCSVSLYIMNDVGGPHPLIKADALQIDLAVYSFYFDTEELKDVIFTSYQTIYKGTEDLIDTYFSFWQDFELGCKENDLIGSAPNLNMVYAYNNSGINCSQPTSIGDSVMVGISVLQGPRAPFIFDNINGVDTIIPPLPGTGKVDTLIDTNLSSVSIPVNCGIGGSGVKCLPKEPEEFFNVMQGLTINGSPIFDDNGIATVFPYNGDPYNPTGSHMCNSNVVPHTSALSSYGPVLMQPGWNSPILKATIVTRVDDPSCPSVETLLYKTQKVHSFFNNDFYHIEGPSAPDLQFSQGTSGLNISINKVPYDYKQSIEYHPQGLNAYYLFEGVKIYQVKSQNFDITELDNPNLSHLVYQGDIANGISEIKNWSTDFDGDLINFKQELKVSGQDSGIENDFIFDYDYVNNKPYDPNELYYFVAISYAFNNYEEFMPSTQIGQQRPYVETTCCKKVVRSDKLSALQNMDYLSPYTFVFHSNEFTLSNISSDLKVILLDIKGRSMNEWMTNSKQSFRSGNLLDLTSGLYIVKVHDFTNNRQYAHKIVVMQ